MKTNVDNTLITKLSHDTSSYDKGLELFLDNKITDVTEEAIDNGFKVCFKIIDGDDNLKVTVKCDHTGTVTAYGCTCEESIDFFGACKHTVSSLFYLSDQNNTNGTQLKTDFITKEMLESFKDNFGTDMFVLDENKNILITLVPEINFSIGGKLFLTFKVATNDTAYYKKNSYIVKNISEFIDNVEDSVYYSYGRDLSFVHNISKFDNQSKRLIKLISTEKANFYDATSIMIRTDKDARVSDFPNDKRLYLSRIGIDKFFELYVDEELAEYKIIEENPKLQFLTNIKDETLSLFRNSIKYFVFYGNSYGYILIGQTIYKVTKKLADILQFFNEAFEKTKNEFITFKNEDIYEFLSFVLPLMREYDLIDKTYISEFYELGFVQLIAKTYFDLDNNEVTCKLVFAYGSNEVVFGQNTEYTGYRDKLTEDEIIKTLLHFGFKIDEGEFVLQLDDDIFNFYSDGIEMLQKRAEIYLTDKFSHKQYKKEKSTTFTEVKIVGDLLEVTIRNNMYTNEELLEALQNYKTKKTYFRLKNGKFINMKDETIINTLKMMNILSTTDVDGKFITTKNKAFFLNDFLHSTEFDIISDDSFNDLLSKIHCIKNQKAYLNDFLKATLRSYQKEGLNWLKGLVDLGFGAILADEMGLGKTLEIIALIQSNIATETSAYIIVCPSSLVYNWKNEFHKFAPEREVELIVGNSKEREDLITKIEKGKVYITTYDMMKRDASFYNNTFFEFVILDEAQYIKNPATIGSKAVKSLKKKTAIALTGTPIENSLKELWSIFDFIMPNYLGDINTFHSTFTLPIMMDSDQKQISMLKRQIQPFILRRFKKDVLKELPKKIETVLYAEMTPEQRLCYEAYFNEIKGEVTTANSINIISKLTRLRQIACHPSLFIDNYSGESGKQESALEVIKSSIQEGHRILFFSQFTSMLDIIKKSLEEEGINYFYIDGKTKSQDREAMCAKFNAGENEIFLISLKAGGTGLNLTGADIVIHYDPWWNPSVMNQASDRAHRFGQTQVVQVINIIAKDTIEEKIFGLQQKKKELIDNVLTDDVQFISKLTKEELLDLFQ